MVKRQKDDIVRKDVGQDYDKKKVLSLSKMNTERKWLNRGRKKGKNREKDVRDLDKGTLLSLSKIFTERKWQKREKIRRKYVGDSHKKRMSPSKMHTERKWLKAEREKEI